MKKDEHKALNPRENVVYNKNHKVYRFNVNLTLPLWPAPKVCDEEYWKRLGVVYL